MSVNSRLANPRATARSTSRCTPSQSSSSNSATWVSERQAAISFTVNASKCSVKCEPGSAYGVRTVLTPCVTHR